MKTGAAALIFFLVGSACDVQAQDCDGVFQCLNSTSFTLCSVGRSQVYTCEGRATCSMECTSHPCCHPPSCNRNGFRCLSDTLATICVDEEPSGDSLSCPQTLACRDHCELPCMPSDCGDIDNPCTEPGFLPHPSDERDFYLCGQFRERARYSCPVGYVYDAEKVCAVARADNQTAFECEREGSYPESTNCSRYHLCVNSSGSLYHMQVACPRGAVYDWASGSCTRDLTACSLSTTTAFSPSTATAFSNSTTTAFFNSTTTAFSPSTATAFSNSTTTAFSNSTTTAFSNSTTTAFSPSTATAFSNSTTTAFSPSTATAFSNSTTTAFSPSTATAFFNSTTTAFSNSTTTAFSNSSQTPSPMVCTRPGSFPDPQNCGRYFACTRSWFSQNLRLISRRCFFWMKFDSVRGRCRPASVATCATS